MTLIKIKTSAVSTVVRGGLLLVVWWILTDGATTSWWIGVPAILLAVVSSILLIAPVNIAWYQILKFVPFFLKHSILGGIDVARRAFDPGLPIAPDLIDYPLRLPPGLPRVVMSNTVNLLPGTLSAELDLNSMKVHVLDSEQDILTELKAVEKQVARIFSISLNGPSRSE